MDYLVIKLGYYYSITFVSTIFNLNMESVTKLGYCDLYLTFEFMSKKTFVLWTAAFDHYNLLTLSMVDDSYRKFGPIINK